MGYTLFSDPIPWSYWYSFLFDHIDDHHDHQASVTGIGSKPLNTHSTSLDPIWLVVWNMNFIFPFSWEFHHPNWRTPSFFRGVGLNHQPVLLSQLSHYYSIIIPLLSHYYPIIIPLLPILNHIKTILKPCFDPRNSSSFIKHQLYKTPVVYKSNNYMVCKSYKRAMFSRHQGGFAQPGFDFLNDSASVRLGCHARAWDMLDAAINGETAKVTRCYMLYEWVWMYEDKTLIMLIMLIMHVWKNVCFIGILGLMFD